MLRSLARDKRARAPRGLLGNEGVAVRELDHVVERAELVRELLSRPEDAAQIIEKRLVGCVVLVSEHKRLPKSRRPNFDDVWWRYREAKPRIGVWCRSTDKWIVPEA